LKQILKNILLHFNTLKHYLLFMGLFSIFSCSTNQHPKLDVVGAFELQRYLGTWYEIAKLPNRFEKGLICVQAHYSLRADGKITVRNQGTEIQDGKPTNKIKDIEGKAWIPDPKEPAKLKVSFFWPFAGDYWVIALSPDYSVALVGDPSREYLWFLARSPKIDESIYQSFLQKAKDAGFDVQKIEKMPQTCTHS
jgi:apolipoprotein D and lipocalin family protein